MATLDFKFFPICQTALTLLPSTVTFPVLADMFLLSAQTFVTYRRNENSIPFFLTRGFLEIRCLSVLPAACAEKCLSTGKG